MSSYIISKTMTVPRWKRVLQGISRSSLFSLGLVFSSRPIGLGFIIFPLVKIVSWTAACIGLFFVSISRKASFLSLNNHSKRYFEKYNKNYDFLKYGVLAASAVSIISGVFANRIYDVLKGLF